MYKLTGGKMTRQYLIAAVVLGISACATTEQEVSRPAGESAETAATTPVPVPTASETAAPEQAAGTDGIVVVDTPEVPKVAVTEEEFDIPNGNERVCRRERRTGTHRAKRVCYTRAEIERMATKSREVLDDLNRSQVEY